MVEHDPQEETVELTVYEAVGGESFFVDLIDRFYDAVADDPVLRPLYPDDLTESRRHLAGFFAQYWGGPAAYSKERGHPRLRMRHVPFAIGAVERDAWTRHMLAALDAGDAPDEVKALIRGYVLHSAEFLRNRD